MFSDYLSIINFLFNTAKCNIEMEYRIDRNLVEFTLKSEKFLAFDTLEVISDGKCYEKEPEMDFDNFIKNKNNLKYSKYFFTGFSLFFTQEVKKHEKIEIILYFLNEKVFSCILKRTKNKLSLIKKEEPYHLVINYTFNVA